MTAPLSTFNQIFDMDNEMVWNDYAFDFEKSFPDLNRPSPSEPCKFYMKGNCVLGQTCPFRHVYGDKEVCKHWLRGLCKKGESCEYLHEYRLDKMPICYFFSKFGECSNPSGECMFRHVSPEEKMRECPWYARGFCKHGPRCRHKHVRKPLCEAYMIGFCPDGPLCKLGHPKYELPRLSGDDPNSQSRLRTRTPVVCHKCGVAGHKAANCPDAPRPDMSQPRGPPRPLESVTCFKCGQMGHYANKCPNKRVNPPPGGYQVPAGGAPGGGGGRGGGAPHPYSVDYMAME